MVAVITPKEDLHQPTNKQTKEHHAEVERRQRVVAVKAKVEAVAAKIANNFANLNIKRLGIIPGVFSTMHVTAKSGILILF